MRQYADLRHYNMPFKNVAVQGFGATIDPSVMPVSQADLEVFRSDIHKMVMWHAIAVIGVAIAADYFFSRRK